jgi:hypothetical protein
MNGAIPLLSVYAFVSWPGTTLPLVFILHPVVPNLISRNTVKGVAFGGLVVSVLATGPKVRGFSPGRGRWIFKGDKNPSEGK